MICYTFKCFTGLQWKGITTMGTSNETTNGVIKKKLQLERLHF